MWRNSNEDVYDFLMCIDGYFEGAMPTSLEPILTRFVKRARANVIDAWEFPEAFMDLVVEYWPNILANLCIVLRPCPSQLCDFSVYGQVGFNFVPMNFGRNNIICYLSWPPLLRMKHAHEFISEKKLQRELKDMMIGCAALKEQQSELYCTEQDRELPFFKWLNVCFCNERTSCVIPQVTVPRVPKRLAGSEFTANGVIYGLGADNFTGEGYWENLKNGTLNIQKGPKIDCDWVECHAEGDSRSAKTFLSQWARTEESELQWYCVIESKREENMFILAQAAGYYFERSRLKGIRSNIPMFGIGLSGTAIKLGVFIYDDLDHLVVYELKTFSFQTGVLSLEELRDMAECLVTFRFLMIEAAAERRMVQNVGCWHVYPSSSILLESRVLLDEPTDLRYPPRRYFSCEDPDNQNDKIRFMITSFGGKLSNPNAMFTFMYSAEAHRAPSSDPSSESSSDSFPVVVRLDMRYGKEAHKKLAHPSLGFAPKLYCAEECYPGYNDIWFVVMDQLDLSSYFSLKALRNMDKLNDAGVQQLIVDKLKRLNKELGTANVVHGDLRPCNIFFSTTSSDLKVLDFEFGTSISGESPVYPLTLNPGAYLEYGCSSPSSLRVLCGSPITHAQDDKMIRYCIDYVESSRMQVDSLPSFPT